MFKGGTDLVASTSAIERDAAAQNRVLRNTYLLLALSMLPTVLGTYIGQALGFQFFAGSPFIGVLVFLGVAFGAFYLIDKFKNSAIGVGLLLAFTFFMGLMLSRLVGAVLTNTTNGSALIMMSFAGTAIIFTTMAAIATTTKRDFTFLGKTLTIGAVVILLAAIANIWLQMPALMLAISALAVVVFSAFILVDLQRVINGGETNYVTATLSIYLSIYNVFSNLLALLGVGFGDRE